MKIDIKYSSFRSVCFLLFLIGIVAGSVFAQDLNLTQLEEAADLIIVGKARVLSIDGLVAAVEIIPVRELKADQPITSQSPIVAQMIVSEDDADAIARLALAQNDQNYQKAQNSLGMWFLKNLGELGWKALPLSGRRSIYKYCAALSDLPLPDHFAYEPATTVQTKIIKELGAQMERLWKNNEPTRRVRDLSLEYIALHSIDSRMDGVVELAERFSKSNSDQLRAYPLLWRIRAGDSKALNEIENDKKLTQRQEAAIATVIGSYRGDDPLFIEGLGKLTSNAFPNSIRQQAGYVLRAVHTKEAVPILVGMLDSDLDDLKYNGVMGLAAFALDTPVLTPEIVRTMGWLRPGPKNKSAAYAIPLEEATKYMPTTISFSFDQARYISYWKNWWVTNYSYIQLS